MSSQLSPSDLFAQAEEIRTCARELMDKRDIFKAQRKNLIDQHAPDSEIKELDKDIDLLTRNITELFAQAQTIDDNAIVITITDLDDAGNQIKTATIKVKNAVQQLKNIQDTLNIVKDFLDLGNAIVTAVISKNPVIQIVGIIKAIDTFNQQISTSTSRGIPLPEETVPVVDRVMTRLEILPNTSYILEISIKIQPAT